MYLGMLLHTESSYQTNYTKLKNEYINLVFKTVTKNSL